jgi:hypothetical protein
MIFGFRVCRAAARCSARVTTAIHCELPLRCVGCADKFSTCQSCNAPVELSEQGPTIQNVTPWERKWTFCIVVGVPAAVFFIGLSAYSWRCAASVESAITLVVRGGVHCSCCGVLSDAAKDQLRVHVHEPLRSKVSVRCV